MKFLIAGLGSIGRRHMRNLLALGESNLVLLRTGKSTLPEEELAAFPQEHDLVTALKDHKPEAVIVANPTAMHLDIAIPAARTGCAIFLEKPVSNSTDRLDELESAVDISGSKLLVGFQFRFHPSLQKMKKLIEAGEIGRLISAHVHFGEYLPAWHPWEDYRMGYAARGDMGGGVVLTQCHSLDYLPWLVGTPKSVWSYTAKLSDLEVDVEDTAKIGLRFESGVLGSLHLDYNQQPPAHRVEIIGTDGSLQCDFSDGVVKVYLAAKKEWQTYPLPNGWERNSMFLDIMKNFVSLAHGEQEPACTLADGVRVQRLVQAVHESNTKRQVVDLNW